MNMRGAHAEPISRGRAAVKAPGPRSGALEARPWRSQRRRDQHYRGAPLASRAYSLTVLRHGTAAAALVRGVWQENSLAFCWPILGAHWYVLVFLWSHWFSLVRGGFWRKRPSNRSSWP